MYKLARTEVWRRLELERPTLRFEQVTPRAADDGDHHDETDGPPTVRAPERPTQPRLRALRARRPPPPPPRMRSAAAPAERESGIRTRPPVREIAVIASLGAPRPRATPSETLVCTPRAPTASLVLERPTRTIVFEPSMLPPDALPPNALPPDALPPKVVIEPVPAAPTARRRPPVSEAAPELARLPLARRVSRRPSNLRTRVPVIALLLAVAFAAFAGVQVAPALRKATAALALR